MCIRDRRRTESDWQLTVTDDGCGLPGEDAQAALENSRSFLGGAQLGLLLCRECCRRMAWSLQLEPAPEKGTQAVVSIPLYTGESRPDGTVELRTSSETEQEQRKRVEEVCFRSLALIGRNCEYLEPVSYTHLDVYKRQI